MIKKIRLIFLSIPAFLYCCCSSQMVRCSELLPPMTLKIESPSPGLTVKGRVFLSTSSTGLPAGSHLQFILNGHTIGLPLHAPITEMKWDSAEMWDGPMRLKVVAINSNGGVLSQSQTVNFILKNGTTNLQILAPNSQEVLHGKIRCEAKATDPEKISLVSFYLDGREVYKEEITAEDLHIAGFTLDTTRLENGVHELCITAARTDDGKLPTAMNIIELKVNNGHLPLYLHSKWREAVLKPGDSLNLSPKFEFTDGNESLVSEAVTFTSRNSSIATVDAHGIVHAVSEGVTDVLIKTQYLEASTRVTVTKKQEFAHFAHDGAILHQYDPKRSLWVRSMFFLSPEEIDRDPRLALAARNAGINTLTTGLYSNPADSHVPDFASWRAGWSGYWAKCERTAKKNGFSLMCTGDDIARSQEEMRNTLENPWAGDAIKYAFNAFRNSGIAVSVEMQDEVGGPVTPEYRKIMALLNSIPNRVPITWPPAGLQSEVVFKSWMGDPKMSDYCSLYWTYIVGTHQQAYPWGRSMEQTRQNLEKFVWDRLPALPLDTPRILLSSSCGYSYTKRVPGEYYQPGLDNSIIAGIEPAGVAAMIMYGAAMGMAGTRVYAHDSFWAREREAAPLGRSDLQTGTAPEGPTKDRWQSMSAAFNLIKSLEPYLLQPKINTLDLGGTIMTGARQGPQSRLFIAVNCSESRPSAHVDLQSFQYPNAKIVTCFRLVGSRMQKQIVPNLSSTLVTFEPGESIIWLFEPSAKRPQ